MLVGLVRSGQGAAASKVNENPSGHVGASLPEYGASSQFRVLVQGNPEVNVPNRGVSTLLDPEFPLPLLNKCSHFVNLQVLDLEIAQWLVQKVPALVAHTGQ